jgi:deazaflavin-dependent oxidoreductase (nitroreductase family)
MVILGDYEVILPDVAVLSSGCLAQPLQSERVKPGLPGHWGATPGLDLIYARLGWVVKRDDLDMSYICGPRRGGSSASSARKSLNWSARSAASRAASPSPPTKPATRKAASTSTRPTPAPPRSTNISRPSTCTTSSRPRLLTVPGRRTGKPRSTPVSPLTVSGGQYVVAGLPDSDWARNVRAAGHAQLSWGRRREPVTLTEVTDSTLKERVMRAYPREVPRCAPDVRPGRHRQRP